MVLSYFTQDWEKCIVYIKKDTNHLGGTIEEQMKIMGERLKPPHDSPTEGVEVSMARVVREF